MTFRVGGEAVKGVPAKETQSAKSAQNIKAQANKQAEIAEDLDELNFIEMVNSVPLDNKSAQLIRKFQEKEGRNRLFSREYNSKNNCTVETFRN